MCVDFSARVIWKIRQFFYLYLLFFIFQIIPQPDISTDRKMSSKSMVTAYVRIYKLYITIIHIAVGHVLPDYCF